MNNVTKKGKKSFVFILSLIMMINVLAGISFIPVEAAEKTVYSFMNDFPTKQGENGWYVNCGASTAKYNAGTKSWTNGDTHQQPAIYKSNVLATCDKGGVSYINFKAPKSGSIAVVFNAKITAPANEGGDAEWGGGLFGIHLTDPKRNNPDEADQQSAEPVYPYGLVTWFISGRYELQDGETLAIEEYIEVEKGQFIQFCFCSKGDPWTFNLNQFEIRYDEDEVTTNNPTTSDTPSQNNGVTTPSNTEKPDTSVQTGEEGTTDGNNETEAPDKNETVDETTDGTDTTNDAETNDEQNENDATENADSEPFNYTPFIIMGVVIVVLIAGIVVAFIICHKKGLI